MLHQDWIMVDESKYRSINCWFPLTTLGENSGAFFVMPGAHTQFPGLRGSPGFASYIDLVRDEIGRHIT
jgi:ectoine hydroxylase-related dioxygenase (phytanoyl-CoA dioxygenase family)